MNMRHLIAAMLLASIATHGFAATAPDAIRKQVVQELARARAAGELDLTDGAYPYAAREAPGTVTRASVEAETRRARAAGEMEITDATYPLSPPMPPSGLTRQAVRAETARALAAGELDCREESGMPCLPIPHRAADK